RVESLSVEDQTSLSMNISSYRSGVYFVKINTIGGSVTRKIIKR
ncbi:T9SS type A sorting domain-containing protein, partial [Aureitalea sp. L0-47]|nr:T9SS type A sorting domain-containing protein [Aureitalea sp. L0-47]